MIPTEGKPKVLWGNLFVILLNSVAFFLLPTVWDSDGSLAVRFLLACWVGLLFSAWGDSLYAWHKWSESESEDDVELIQFQVIVRAPAITYESIIYEKDSEKYHKNVQELCDILGNEDASVLMLQRPDGYMFLPREILEKSVVYVKTFPVEDN